jgi:uncharacterized protein (TIGR03067 family)
MTVTFEGDRYIVKKGDEVIQAATQKLDPSRSPKTLDVTVTEGLNKGAVILGIYEISGDTLKVCFDPEGKKRPTEFKSASGSQTLVIHKRVSAHPRGSAQEVDHLLQIMVKDPKSEKKVTILEYRGKDVSTALAGGNKLKDTKRLHEYVHVDKDDPRNGTIVLGGYLLQRPDGSAGGIDEPMPPLRLQLKRKDKDSREWEPTEQALKTLRKLIPVK